MFKATSDRRPEFFFRFTVAKGEKNPHRHSLSSWNVMATLVVFQLFPMDISCGNGKTPASPSSFSITVEVEQTMQSRYVRVWQEKKIGARVSWSKRQQEEAAFYLCFRTSGQEWHGRFLPICKNVVMRTYYTDLCVCLLMTGIQRGWVAVNFRTRPIFLEIPSISADSSHCRSSFLILSDIEPKFNFNPTLDRFFFQPEISLETDTGLKSEKNYVEWMGKFFLAEQNPHSNRSRSCFYFDDSYGVVTDSCAKLHYSTRAQKCVE